MTLSSPAGGVHREAQVLREINKGERVSDILGEAKGITFATGDEVAAVSLQNGKRVLVQGGAGGITNLEAIGAKRVLGHTHPFGGVGPVVPSEDDVSALRQLGQTHSFIIERGQTLKFRSK